MVFKNNGDVMMTSLITKKELEASAIFDAPFLVIFYVFHFSWNPYKSCYF